MRSGRRLSLALAPLWRFSVAACDTVRDFVPGLDRRCRVRARWERAPEFEFVTWGSPVAVLKTVRVVPGWAERLFLFAFIGDRSATGHETREAVGVGTDERERLPVGAAGAH